MGYSNNYRSGGISGLSGTAYDYAGCMKKLGAREPDKAFVKSWCDNSKACHESCNSISVCPEGTEAYARTGSRGVPNCDCGCRSSIRVNPNQGGYGNIIPAQVGRRTNAVNGMNGLNESFLESLGTVGNLAIVGLAIYGGYALAKKM